MGITIGQLLIWIVIGALVGSVVGTLTTGSKSGYGRWKNLGIGLAGALIGGVLFRVFGIDLGLGELKITVEDLLSAFIGSLLLLGVLWVVRKKKSGL